MLFFTARFFLVSCVAFSLENVGSKKVQPRSLKLTEPLYYDISISLSDKYMPLFGSAVGLKKSLKDIPNTSHIFIIV